MMVRATASRSSWRAAVGLGLAACIGAATVAAVAPAPTPTPALDRVARQAADPLKFTRSGRMLLVYQVAPDKAEDFVLTWRTIKDLLAKTNDPGLTAFSRSLRIDRVETVPGADAVFLFDLDPVSTTYSYHPVTLLFETLAEKPDQPGVGLTYAQATELYEKVKEANASTWWLSSID